MMRHGEWNVSHLQCCLNIRFHRIDNVDQSAIQMMLLHRNKVLDIGPFLA